MKPALHIGGRVAGATLAGWVAAAALLAGADSKPAPRHERPAAPPGARGLPARPPAANLAGRPNPKARRQPAEGIAGAAGSPLERWNRMTPEQRERQLQKLPPERQQQIRERLTWFNGLPEEERARLQRRYERFNSLPPARQDLVRRQIRNFSELPQDRRPIVSREFDQLRRLPPEERKARLASEEFRSTFSAKEREILSDLSENLALPQPR